MAKQKKPIGIKIETEAGRRTLVRTFSDGSVTREPVDDKTSTKRPARPYQTAKLDHSRKRGV